ncbi:MAG: MFS transporter [Lachnospiraceae bacterium]|nr:MFS transporter [Lachnospiraceae bacterium]
MENNKLNQKISGKTWALIWILGLAGQLCWSVENQWFNTFVYAKIAADPWIVSWMVAVSSIVTTFSTFFFGTWSDRLGKRKPFVFIGYMLWGVFTILFGVTEFLPKNELVVAAIMVIAMDALMSFFGSMGNDAAFSSWTTDLSNDKNRGQIGAVLAALPIIATIVGTVVSGILIAALDYFAFFIIVGVFVIIIGLIGLIFMREADGISPNKDQKGFWHQFFSVFNFKNIKENKELFCVFLISCVYFICFNFYYTHIGNYFIYTLGYDEGMAGIIQGVGLGLAIFATLPAIKLINKGQHVKMIAASVVFSVIGLGVIGFAGSNIVMLLPGIILAGVGYVLVVQTTTAWSKGLYPEGNFGQYEGVRIVFNVMIPMVIGPSAASILIERFGNPVMIDDKPGMAPTAVIFFAAGILSVLTLIPMVMAAKQKVKAEK